MINEQSEKANRAWVLALVSVASFMVALDALAVTTAHRLKLHGFRDDQVLETRIALRMAGR